VDVAAHGSQAPPAAETVHTTTEHPFLTTDRGWVDAQDLVPGERVQQLDGSVGVVVSLRVVAGTAVRYNLTVQDVHTFAVGTDQWVVHNCGDGIPEGYQPNVPDSRVLHATQHAVDMGALSDDFAARKAFLEAAARSSLRVTRRIFDEEGIAHLVRVAGYARRFAVVFFRDAAYDESGRLIHGAGDVATTIYPSARDYERMMRILNR
jgi:hypothetical protein